MIAARPECNQAAQKVSDGEFRYAVYKVDGDEIVVESTSNDADYKTFVASLPADSPRYATYTLSDGGDPEKTKAVFITWMPDDASIALKMKAASAAQALKAATGVDRMSQIHATAYDEMEYDSVRRTVFK
ncbi:hypothetical protein [Streptomyces sp. NPDC005141]